MYPKPNTSSHHKNKDKILSSHTSRYNVLPKSSPQDKEEELNKNLNQTIESLLSYQIGDPAFDEITVEAEVGRPLNQDDYLNLLNRKLSKLVEILQREDKQVKNVEQEGELLNKTYADKKATLEELVEKAKTQLEDLKVQHSQFTQEAGQTSDQSMTLEIEVRAKEGAILDLNKNIQQLMAEFIRARDRNDRVDRKLRGLREGKRIEDEEIRGPRPGSPEHEERMNKIWAVEKSLKEKEEIHRYLEIENNDLRQQLKELAPHSLLSADDRSPKEARNLVDLEKYVDMKPEDIHKEIEILKGRASRQQDLINQLEAKNKEDIDAINLQKARIEGLRGQYVEQMEKFYQTKQKREKSLAQCNQLEGEISHLIKSYNGLSSAIEKGGSKEAHSYREIGIERKEEKRASGSRFYQYSGAERDNRDLSKEGSVPAPSRLVVSPSAKDIRF